MKVGDKVVCVKSKWGFICGHNPVPTIAPIKGEIYKIRDINVHPDYTSGVGFNLFGLGLLDYFSSEGFRPVDESFGEEVAERLKDELIQKPHYVEFSIGGKKIGSGWIPDRF